MVVRYLKNPDPHGPELALCTRHEYDTMVAALAERVDLKPNVAPMPVEVANAISRGMSTLAALRAFRNIELYKLAALSGVHHNTIRKMEAKNWPPTTDAIRLALARALVVPPAWLG